MGESMQDMIPLNWSGEADPNQWRIRIVGFGLVDPSELLAHPNNWRIHPMEQQEAAKTVLSEVGWWDVLKINVRTGHVLDGHMRDFLALRHSQQQVPVLYVDLDESEEMIALTTHDPISAMAVPDRAKLAENAHALEVENAEIMQLIESVLAKNGVDPNAGNSESVISLGFDGDATEDFAEGDQFAKDGGFEIAIRITRDQNGNEELKSDLVAFCEKHGLAFKIRPAK